ncbi:transposase [Tritonibacter mobilis]|uniref:transposase n=1 Tax=Tritonibacter mobilis TaxID=379347 RepID=UPI0013A53C43
MPPKGVTCEWPTEDSCRARLAEVRWPNGIECPRGSSAHVGLLDKRQTFYCNACRCQFTVQSGSLFHHSRVALQLWFLTAEIIIQNRASVWYSGGPTGHALKDMLGISYAAAYKLKRKIIAELQLPNGGVIGQCILMPADIDRPDDDDLSELNELLYGIR